MNKTDIFKIIKSIKGYQTSLKHDSYDKRQKNSNKPFQKYEFLGDRVLGLVISEYLINNFSDSSLQSAQVYGVDLKREDVVKNTRLN